jgi:hypothetical protein
MRVKKQSAWQFNTSSGDLIHRIQSARGAQTGSLRKNSDGNRWCRRNVSCSWTDGKYAATNAGNAATNAVRPAATLAAAVDSRTTAAARSCAAAANAWRTDAARSNCAHAATAAATVTNQSAHAAAAFSQDESASFPQQDQDRLPPWLSENGSWRQHR